MKIRKFLAAAAAAVIGTAALTVSAGAYDAFLMFADSTWSGWGCWNPEDCAAGSVDVSADGTYTVFIDTSLATSMVESEETGEMVPVAANGVQVFCVDIRGLAEGKGCGTAGGNFETAYDKMAFAQQAGINVSDISIKMHNTDGTSTDVEVDQSKVVYGDIEGNGNLRIEICNPGGGGVTGTDSPIDSTAIAFDEKLEVTFTITGVSEDGADAPAPAPDAVVNADDKQSPDTGVEGIAVIGGVAVLAAGALFVAKKRK